MNTDEINEIMAQYLGKEDDIKSIIEDGTKIKEWELPIYYIVKLIKSLNDPEYIKNIINNPQKMKEIGIYDPYAIFELIKSTEDSKYIESFLDDDSKLEQFEIYDMKLELLKATGDAKYIENIIENDRFGYEIDSDNMIELILATEDYEYIWNTIKNNRKMENLGLDTVDIAFLKIKASDNARKIIEQELADQYFQIKNDNIVNLIALSIDMEYVEEILTSKEKTEKLQLNNEDIIQIISKLAYETRNIDKLRELFDTIFKERFLKDNNNQENISKINLPLNMTIGIEIETLGKMSSEIMKLSDIIGKGWICKIEGSASEVKNNEEIVYGIEVVSPILTGDTEKSSEKIKEICEKLNLMRTIHSRNLWRAYPYRSRLFNYRKKLEEFNRNMGKY